MKLLHCVMIALLTVPALHCAKSPPQLSPIGDVAFYATKAIQGVGALQQMAMDAEAVKAISTDDARTIVSATKIAGQAGVDLAAALKAGVSATTAKERAVVMIRQALTDVPARLSPHARDLATPYINVVLIALTVFGGLS